MRMRAVASISASTVMRERFWEAGFLGFVRVFGAIGAASNASRQYKLSLIFCLVQREELNISGHSYLTHGEFGDMPARPLSPPVTSRPARARRSNSRLVLSILCIGMAAVLLGSCDTVRRVASVPANFTSHHLCSAVFVGGLDPTEYYKEAIAPKLGAAGKLVRYDVDSERREVRVSLAGLVESRAIDEGPS